MIGLKRLSTKKKGPQVEYIKCEPFRIHKYLADIVSHYKAGEVFVLSPSIKAGTPVKSLENTLVAQGIPCYVPISDESKLDLSIIEGKVVFTTFHQAKGRERPLVIIYGFDASYFKFFAKDEDKNSCPNTLYVGATRASHKLILIADEKQDQLPFLKNLEDTWYLKIKSNVYTKPSKIKKNVVEEECHKTSVTDFVKFIKNYYLNDLAIIINKLWDSIVENNLSLDIPSKTEGQTGQYEEVSDLNGLALPAYYQNRKSKAKIDYLSEYIKISNSKLINSKNLLKKLTGIESFLNIANLYTAVRTGMHFKLSQVKSYSWITEKDAITCMNNMDKYIGNVTDFELELREMDGEEFKFESEYGIIKLSGIIDAYEKNPNGDIIWEFKCVENLQLEHFLQASIYQWIWNNTRKDSSTETRLFNIRTGEIYKLNNDDELLNLLITVLLRNKYEKNIDETDDNFIKKYKAIREPKKIELDFTDDEDDSPSLPLPKCLL